MKKKGKENEKKFSVETSQRELKIFAVFINFSIRALKSFEWSIAIDEKGQGYATCSTWYNEERNLVVYCDEAFKLIDVIDCECIRIPTIL